MPVSRNLDFPQHNYGEQAHYGELPFEALPDATGQPSGTVIKWDGFTYGFGVGAGSSGITVKEQDNSPTVSPVTTIVLSGANVVDLGGGNVLITMSSSSGVSADEKTKVSSNDTTEDYLLNKLVGGTGVTIVENNDGGDESLTISAVNTSGSLSIVSSNDTTPDYLINKIDGIGGIDVYEYNNGANEVLVLSGSNVGLPFSITRVWLSGTQNVSGSAVNTTISWTHESEDTDGLWDISNPTQFVIPSSLNGRRAVVIAQNNWSASTSGGYRHINVLQNALQIAVQELQDPSSAVAAIIQASSYPITLTTGDTITCRFRVDTTGIGVTGTFDGQTYMCLYTID